MRFQQFVLTAFLFGSAAVAAQLNKRQAEDFGVLEKRQQFVPSTTTAQGDTCAEAFGEGYVTCREATASSNRFCYNPTIGQTCCSNTWACPNGSFCLVSNYCCPNGQDAASCAIAKGVTLPSGFGGASPTGIYPAGNATTAAPTGSATKSGPPSYYTNGASSKQVGLAGIAGAIVLAGML